MVRTMTKEDAEPFILQLLKEKGSRTTKEIMEESSRQGLKCPESTGSFLARMRFQGKIIGEFSLPKKSWLWKYPPSL